MKIECFLQRHQHDYYQLISYKTKYKVKVKIVDWDDENGANESNRILSYIKLIDKKQVDV